MTAAQFQHAKDYMTHCMKDSTHHRLHVLRVLNYAMILARSEAAVNREVLILAALLHDVGRGGPDREGGHAAAGSEMARAYLRENGYPAQTVEHVAGCIATHSAHEGEEPRGLEAKLLYDADKLDQTGGVGVARCLLGGGQEPLYVLDHKNLPLEDGEEGTLFRAYSLGQLDVLPRLYTWQARRLAREQQRTLHKYFHGLIDEVNYNHAVGDRLLREYFGVD